MTEPPLPPRPASRPDRASLLQQIRGARGDLFSILPEKIYSAWMAHRRGIPYDSFIINDPALVKLILEERPDDFPKTDIIRDTLKLLLGDSVFVTNGEVWKRQRRIIDPAFEGGRLREVFPEMLAAGQECVARLAPRADGAPVEMEFVTAHAAADVIFRTLFSLPIEDEKARAVFDGFRAYQRAQPLMNVTSLLKLPSWVPRRRSAASAEPARHIRALLTEMIDRRVEEIAAGTAPDDLATKIMTTRDPQGGDLLGPGEMVDQVAIFFLAGHETSASALAWTLYLLATHPEAQERAAAEAAAAWAPDAVPAFADMRRLPFVRDVFREALRLYPPVPMMVREPVQDETFRKRRVRRGSLCILSPWHLQRHRRIWEAPDAFDPDRWARPETRETARRAYMPFSAGPRVCTGAGFAMVEGVVLLALLLRAYRFAPVEGRVPVPVQHLTVRAKDGIWLRVERRGEVSAPAQPPSRAST